LTSSLPITTLPVRVYMKALYVAGIYSDDEVIATVTKHDRQPHRLLQLCSRLELEVKVTAGRDSLHRALSHTE
jgi:hypothetical protein